MKFTEEIVEVGGTGCFVAFDGQQLLQLPVPLLEDPAIGAFRHVPLHRPRGGFGEPPVGEIVQQFFCVLAIHIPQLQIFCEQSLQLLARVKQPRAHGPFRAVQRLGDIRVRQSLHIMHDHDRSVVF